MLKLIKAQVWKYKSIEDSTPVELSDQVTVLVGKNESGKTAFLEALHKGLPLDGVKFNFVSDYPRKDLVRYRPQHEAKNYQKVVELSFRIEKELADKINRDVFGGEPVIPAGATFSHNTTIGNTSTIGFHPDQKAALAALQKPLVPLEARLGTTGDAAHAAGEAGGGVVGGTGTNASAVPEAATGKGAIVRGRMASRRTVLMLTRTPTVAKACWIASKV